MSISEASNPALLDLQHLRAMLRSDADVRHVLSVIESSLQEQISEIDRHIGNDDVQAAHSMLHQFKGLLPVFCSDSMAKQLADITEISRTATAKELKAHYAQLRPKLEQFGHELSHWLNNAAHAGTRLPESSAGALK